MQNYFNNVASTLYGSNALVLLPYATCTVYLVGTSIKATIYSDEYYTPLANPFTASATGQVLFYADNGRYDLYVSKTNYVPVTIPNIELVDVLAPSGSNSVGYLPAGTGAVVSTVQSKLRQIKSASDYDTFANYSSNALSGGFFTQNGAVIQRMTDRLMVGGAALNDCAYPNVYKDWLTTYQNTLGTTGLIVASQAAVLNSGSTSETGACGFLSGIQSLNFASAATAAIGITGYVLNNNDTYATNGWALYAEAHRTGAAANAVYACELDTRTTKATSNPTPFTQGSVIGLQIASGCGVSATGQFDASAAIQIAKNPMKFRVGINFGADSITGADGTTGTGIAIAMAYGHIIRWYNSAGAQIGSIFSTCADTANATRINFTDNGLQIGTAAGEVISYFSSAASSVNWLSFSGAITGNPVTITATGSDTNVDLRLLTKGSGLVRYGAYTAGVVAQAGYITIKDSGGTTRRLLVG
jgi:hypothetical protein